MSSASSSAVLISAFSLSFTEVAISVHLNSRRLARVVSSFQAASPFYDRNRTDAASANDRILVMIYGSFHRYLLLNLPQ